MKFWFKDWRGSREILYPDEVESGEWNYRSLFLSSSKSHHKNLWLTIDPDPDSLYHFLVQFQWTKGMFETIMSLPTRDHVAKTGKNTYRIPIQDLYIDLEVICQHDRHHGGPYMITISEAVEEAYRQVELEDKEVQSVAHEGGSALDIVRELIKQSRAVEVGTDEFRLYRFQEAGIAAILSIFGVVDKLKPGTCKLRIVSQ